MEMRIDTAIGSVFSAVPVKEKECDVLLVHYEFQIKHDKHIFRTSISFQRITLASQKEAVTFVRLFKELKDSTRGQVWGLLRDFCSTHINASNPDSAVCEIDKVYEENYDKTMDALSYLMELLSESLDVDEITPFKEKYLDFLGTIYPLYYSRE